MNGAEGAGGGTLYEDEFCGMAGGGAGVALGVVAFSMRCVH